MNCRFFSSPSPKKPGAKLTKPKAISKTPSPAAKARVKSGNCFRQVAVVCFLYLCDIIYIIILQGSASKSKTNKLSLEAKQKAEKRKSKDTSGVSKKEKKAENGNGTINGAKIVKENDTVECKKENEKEKEEPVSSKLTSKSDKAKKVKKSVKKKRARIIEPVDSSDDEDHLPVNIDLFRELNFFIKKFYAYKNILLY